MINLLVTLLIIVPLNLYLFIYVWNYLKTNGESAFDLNVALAPFLFPLFSVLFIAFRLDIIKDYLVWLGLSESFLFFILIIAVLDNVVIFLVKERRIVTIIKTYVEYLRTELNEFILVLFLALISSATLYFKLKAVFLFPEAAAAVIFAAMVVILPLILYHYRNDNINFDIHVKPGRFLLFTAKAIFACMSPLILVKTAGILLSGSGINDRILLLAIVLLEVLFFIIFKNTLIVLPGIIMESRFISGITNRLKLTGNKITGFIYHNIELSAVLFLLFIIFWPVAVRSINEYRNWRSNFPYIEKATPIMGMQGSMVILTGKNFGTTGLGVPGEVIVNSTKLMISEWNDNKIIATVPVSVPEGELFIRKRFKWKAVEYTADSNKYKYSKFEWSGATKEDIDNYLNILKRNYTK